MKIKELNEKMQKALKESKELRVALKDAETEEAQAEAKKALDAKVEEVKTVKAELEEAIEAAEFEKSVSGASEKAGSFTTVNVPAGGTLAQKADARDHDKELRAKEGIFLKYMSEGITALSGEEQRAMQPGEGSKMHDSEVTAGAVCLPKSAVLSIMGAKWAKQMGWSKQDIMRTVKASTMVSGTDALGGYTVPEDFRLPMLDLMTEAPALLNRVTVMPAPTGEVTMPKAKQTDSDEYGGMVGEWIEEGGLKPKTDTRFEQVKITTHEYAMHTQISIRLLNRSAIAMEQWLQTRGRQVMNDALDSAIINGDGSGKPLGILQTDGIRERKRDTANTVTRSDCTKLKFKLKPYHRAGGVYVMDDTVLEVLEDLTDNDGRQLFTASMANGPFDRLCGYPYIVTTRTPNLGNDGDLMFADLREYYMPMEQDIMIKRSDDFAITRNLATIVMFVVAGGKFVQPRVGAILGDSETS